MILPWVVQATNKMVYDVAMRMRDRDFEELRAVSWEDTREDIAIGLATQHGGHPFAFCFGIEDNPIAIVTGHMLRPNVWSMGMWASDDLPKIGKFLTKFMLKHGFRAMREAGAHRVECKSIVGYNEVHSWLRFLGFAEGEPEKMCGKGGEDFITFYWHEGMPPPRCNQSPENPRSHLDSN